MKKIASALLLLAGFTTIFLVQSCKSKTASAKVLAFNLEKGKSYEYNMVWDMDQQLMGQNNKITIAADYALDVIDDQNGIKSLKAVYNKFKMYMKISGMELEIDTDKPVEPLSREQMKANPADIMTGMFAGIKGKDFTMQVDREGNVLQVNGFEQIVKGMVDSVHADENMKMQIRASLQDQFNDQNIKDQFAQVFTIFPNREVKVGDSWEKSWQIGGRMPANYVTKYTVKDVEGDHVNLDAKTSIQSENEQMKVKGTQDGKLLVDANTGLVINATFVQEIATTAGDINMKMIGKGKITGRER
jgi:hypothetical protein